MACATGPTGKLLTISDFLQLPEEDAYRVELVRGRLVREPKPAPLHGRATGRLYYRLERHVEEHGGGVVLVDVGVVLARDPDTVRGPDIAFYSTERIPESGYGAGFWGPPDLAIEVLSPSNRWSEMRAKVAEYLTAGVRQVWVVDPAKQTVAIHEADGNVALFRDDDVLDGGDLLPGFNVSLRAFLEP